MTERRECCEWPEAFTDIIPSTLCLGQGWRGTGGVMQVLGCMEEDTGWHIHWSHFAPSNLWAGQGSVQPLGNNSYSVRLGRARQRTAFGKRFLGKTKCRAIKPQVTHRHVSWRTLVILSCRLNPKEHREWRGNAFHPWITASGLACCYYREVIR
jgi:hypothetical protein